MTFEFQKFYLLQNFLWSLSHLNMKVFFEIEIFKNVINSYVKLWGLERGPRTGGSLTSRHSSLCLWLSLILETLKFSKNRPPWLRPNKMNGFNPSHLSQVFTVMLFKKNWKVNCLYKCHNFRLYSLKSIIRSFHNKINDGTKYYHNKVKYKWK